MMPVSEVIVVAGRVAALDAGMGDRYRHKIHPEMLFWWPGLDLDMLRGVMLARVSWLVSRAETNRDPEVFELVRQHLRTRLRLPNARWVGP